MKSALECFRHVAKCEEQARQATSEAGHAALLETAKHWHTLGKEAKATEASDPRERPASARANPTVSAQIERARPWRASKLRGDS